MLPCSSPPYRSLPLPTSGTWARGRECQNLAAPGMALGAFEGACLQEASAQMHPGDLLLLYTDGITDARSTAGEFFGVERLRSAACTAATLGAKGVCDAVFAHVSRFQAQRVQYDDMAVLVARVATR